MPTKLQHQTPLWVRSESTFFITLCANPPGQNHFCNPVIGPAVLESIRRYHLSQKWFCPAAVLMPDHLHLLVSIPPDRALSKVVAFWKRWLSRHYDVRWQPNFFEHRLRGNESERQKGDYILHNPVRAGLVSKIEAWPYFWMAPP